jgi:hypothetical protein
MHDSRCKPLAEAQILRCEWQVSSFY